MKSGYIGAAVNRVDGYLKVRGEAKYAAEYQAEQLCYGVVVSSSIAKGKIKTLDASKALALDGVLQVFSHENRTSLPWFDRSYKDEDQPPGSPFRPFYSNEIQFNMQPIALVVAESFELARYAATLIDVEYKAVDFNADFLNSQEKAYEAKKGKSGWKPPKSRGNASKALKHADVLVEATYFHPAEHHNPLELHASTVVVEADDTFTVYDKTQGVFNSQQYLMNIFGLSKAEVHVKAPYIGGAFGSGLRPQYQLFMAFMAAKALKRSVRVVLTRQQMFSFGHRPMTTQQLSLAASSKGKLVGIKHEAIAETSQFEEYTENVVNWSGMLYDCPDVDLSYKLLKLDTYTPLDMRAPGGATGVYAFEAAIDELACKAGVDPLQFRLLNYAEQEQNEKLPFSSKELKACYAIAADKFGWARRNPIPGQLREGDNLLGVGMATGVWEAQQQQVMAKAKLSPDGQLVVSCGTADIGTGTYTVMSQIAAETLGLPIEDVSFLLGDSDLPMAPLQGGSWTASSVGPAVLSVCEGLKEKLLKEAAGLPHSGFKGAKVEEVLFKDGMLCLKGDPSVQLSIAALMKQRNLAILEHQTASMPDPKQSQYGKYTHSAVFVEVKVDAELGNVQVSRVVVAVAAGRILNPKTARSQVLGGVVWGISMALEEESVMDKQYGRFINHDLAEYHVAVNADVHDIEVIFVEEEDDVINPLGVKGLGEIGIVGVPAAISNAIYNATGKRLRALPFTLDKLLE
ncbi:aldehyde oxidase [Pedobacter quisquiliarum]|uniref:Aldehyde oxidase n=1 Tax=Pedobacter quisquiliarum TaxID=1834438 RepID=A0A916XBF1_9SPHI|nr:xanthine dehydrogenase family protein molybdopterin-binding subunit [Pedobacter quisquiliarum]GGC59339.1 aldehyde oxidase [Pedobacter quisquiliarum]